MDGSCANPNTWMKINLTALHKEKTDNIYVWEIWTKYLNILSHSDDYSYHVRALRLNEKQSHSIGQGQNQKHFKYELYE